MSEWPRGHATAGASQSIKRREKRRVSSSGVVGVVLCAREKGACQWRVP